MLDNLSSSNIGVMQGRLSNMVNNKIQSFPWDNWEKEFEICQEINIKKIEWTLDYDELYQNPLMNKVGQKRINYLCKKYNIEIPSLTGDCFMQVPFWKEENHKNKQLISDLKNIIHSCKEAKISMIVIPLVDNGKIQNDLEEKYLIQELNKLKDLLREKKVKILFESDYEPNRLKNFINKFDLNYFGINYDTGNSASMGFDPLIELKTYGELATVSISP